MMRDRVTVKDILIDKYDEFKNVYWSKVPRNMRQHIDETVNKALRCSDISLGYAEYLSRLW